ncbi:MAG: pyridine nucleotide-disulfide oxidoreductase [Steroidobacterales bacterium]
MSVVAREIRDHSLPRLRWPIVWTIIVGLILVCGACAHLERFITPQRGVGYWLGIVGGSMMILLLLYSARKRATWLRWMGGIPAWFEFHMVLGVIGPVLVLFHANFHLGATNSNVALICMLLVAGSGVIGRYLYTRLHAHMDGNGDTLEQLKAMGERLRTQKTSIELLPGLVDGIDRIEKHLIDPPKSVFLRPLHLLVGPFRLALARLLVRHQIRKAVRIAAQRELRLAKRHVSRLTLVTIRYADRRFEAGRRMVEFQAYERLFSLWHILHIPLFFMLLIAGIVHVIAVNVY